MTSLYDDYRNAAFETFLKTTGLNEQPYSVRVKMGAAFMAGLAAQGALEQTHNEAKNALGFGPLDCPACGGSGHRNDVPLDVLTLMGETHQRRITMEGHPVGLMQPTISDPLGQMCKVENDAIADLAKTMMERMAQKRAEGFAGWMTCAPAVLVHRLLSSLWQGKYVDAANFTMMLRARGVLRDDVARAMTSDPHLKGEQHG